MPGDATAQDVLGAEPSWQGRSWAAEPPITVRTARGAELRLRGRSGFELGPRPFLVGVPFLAERLGVDVVAADLPEAPLVLVDELEPGEPLRALPGVPLRHDEPERPPVLRLEVLSPVRPRDQDVIVAHRLEGEVRRVAVLAVG